MVEEKTYIQEGGMISNKKNLLCLTSNKWSERWGLVAAVCIQGFRATCTWKRVGREGSVAQGYGVGVDGGGYSPLCQPCS